MPSAGYSKYQKIVSLSVDLVLINIAFFMGYLLRFNQMISFDRYEVTTLLLIFNFAWWLIITQTSFLISVRGTKLDKKLLRCLRNILIHLAIVYLAFVFLRFYGMSRLMLLLVFAFEVILLIAWRVVYFKLINWYRRAGYNFRNTVIIGTNKNAMEVYRIITENKSYGFRFHAFFDLPEHLEKIKECPVYPIDQFEKFAEEHAIDEVFCTLSGDILPLVSQIIGFCETHVIRLKLIPDFRPYIKRKVTIDFLDNIPLVLLRTEPLQSTASRLIKRVFDIVFALLVILFVLSWLLPLVALIIKLESKGPVFFIQERTGRNNETFRIIKFRSMHQSEDAHEKQATKDDARITFLGRFLRKSNIDELPQFFNVLKGDMSVVGPRPHMLKHTQQYSEIIGKYMVRHFVKPGITGWAQVNGYRGETTNPMLMEKRVEFDVWYLENWTFMLDIYIIFRTIGNMLKGEENAG